MALPNPPLPKLTEGYLGKQGKFDEFGLTTITHPDPVIFLSEELPQVELMVGTTGRTRMMCKLLSHERKQECNDYVLIRCLGPSYSWLVRPPLPGFYKLQLYALPSGVAGPNFIGVYNYVIYCPKAPDSRCPLPKQYPMWKDTGCYLSEPLFIPQGHRGPVLFKLNIPNAKSVKLKVEKDWHEIPMVEPGIFEGVVDLSNPYPVGSKAKVNVQFPQTGAKYNTLLEYTI